MVLLYHYTDKRGLRGIRRDNMIQKTRTNQQPSSNDMRFGSGVYLTSKDPDKYSKEELAENNWQGGGASMMERGKLDHHVWIKIPERDPYLECFSDEGRDVWLYRKAIDLDRFDWDSDLNSNWTPLQIAGVVGGVALGLAAIGGIAWLVDSMTENNQKKEEEQRRAGRR